MLWTNTTWQKHLTLVTHFAIVAEDNLFKLGIGMSHEWQVQALWRHLHQLFMHTHIGGKFIFHQYQSSVNIDIQSVAHEKTNYIQKNQWNVIIHSCFNSNGSFAKPPIKLGMD